MDGAGLRQKFSRSMGQAARFCGVPYRVFRPQGLLPPLSPRLGAYTIYAHFTPQLAQGAVATRLNDALWLGQFDTCYTHPGDYLVGDGNVFFVATQIPVQAPVCVKTNTVISVYAGPLDSPARYAGFQIETAVVVTMQWPAFQALQSGSGGANVAATQFGEFAFILPAGFPDIDAGLVVLDEGGRCYLVTAIEHGALGRLLRATAFSA
jgi:hypothetical protein